jgi:hypothetical protein
LSSIRWLSTSGICSATASDTRRPAPYAVIKIARCFKLDSAVKNRSTSSRLAFDANHTDDKKHERALEKILRKIERILRFYCEAQQADENAPQSRPNSFTVPMISGSSEVPAEF